MKILVSGSSGLVGSALTARLEKTGHRVVRLVRSASRGADELSWDPAEGRLDRAGLEGFDAVVHLAGENIAGGRWNAARKALILDSRVRGTKLLAEALAGLERPPRVFICASAIGYYGSRGEETLTEESPAGTGFLAEVCAQWEEASRAAAQKGIRTANLRLGMVLSAKGGALAQMLTPFKLGVGGVVGSGRQYYSWISIDDVVGVIERVLSHDELRGPINAVSPAPLTNREFTQALGRALGRPTIFPMPAFAARLAFGEMADELLLAGAKVEPAKLKASGYAFKQPELGGALAALLA